MGDLITRDFRNVEIMATGKWEGRGCPPGGCPFTEDTLQEIADATNTAMAANHTAPVKLGHDRQTILEQEELPAGGWLENIRRSGDKLFADVVKVPNRIAQIMEAGGWRNRSVELQQINGKLVLSGLALLGTKLPAINTLNDIEALYASLDLGEPAETVLVFVDTKDADHTSEWLTTIAELHPEAKTQIAALTRVIDGGIEMDLKVLAAKVGLGEDATEDQVMAKLDELNKPEEKPEEKPEVKPEAKTETPETIAASKNDKAEITALSARVLEFETREAQRDASDLVEAAITEGKILPAQRETSLNFALRDADGFKAFVKAQPTILEFGERGTSDNGTDDGDFEPTELELSIAAQTGQTADMIKHQKMIDAGETPPVELSEKVFGKVEA